jgi:hypothetical protein
MAAKKGVTVAMDSHLGNLFLAGGFSSEGGFRITPAIVHLLAYLA